MTEKHPWMKFYVADFMSDESLALVSLAATGLWIKLLCVMHSRRPRGRLKHPNGDPYSTAEIARLARTTEAEAADLLGELERCSVLSRDDDGAIYCRRMVREDSLSEKKRKAAEARWNAEPDAPDDAQPHAQPHAPDHAPSASASAYASASDSDSRRGDARGEEPEAKLALGTPPPPRLTRDSLVRAWNGLAEKHKLAKVRGVTKGSKRARDADALIKALETEAELRAYVDRLGRANGALGRGRSGWRLDFDLFVRPGTRDRVFEGKYDEAWKGGEEPKPRPRPPEGELLVRPKLAAVGDGGDGR